MQKLTLAILATLTLINVAAVNAQEQPAQPAPTENAAPLPDIVLTADFTVEGSAILAPGTVLGADMDVSGLKYGDFVSPRGRKLRAATALQFPLELRNGMKIPSGTTINGASRFEHPEKLPAPAYVVGGNLIPGDQAATPADLTFEARRQSGFNRDVVSTLQSLVQQQNTLAQQGAETAAAVEALKQQVSGHASQIQALTESNQTLSASNGQLDARLSALEGQVTELKKKKETPPPSSTASVTTTPVAHAAPVTTNECYVNQQGYTVCQPATTSTGCYTQGNYTYCPRRSR